MRSTARLIAFSLLATLVSFFLWRSKLWWKAPLVLTAFFVLVYLLELLSVRRNEAAAAREVDSEPPVTPVFDAEFTLVSDPDNECDWYQKRIMLGGRVVRVRISDRPGTFEAALPHAEALIINPDLLAKKFFEFKTAQTRRFPSYTEEVLGLEIESIDFVSLKEPASAAVYFTEESLGDVFMCALENGEFCALWIES